MKRQDYLEELTNEGGDPCVKCGSDAWEMNWDDGWYYCSTCGEKLYDEPMKEKKVRLYHKMKAEREA